MTYELSLQPYSDLTASPELDDLHQLSAPPPPPSATDDPVDITFEPETDSSRLSPLPVELLQAIAATLPQADLARLLRVNSFFHAAIVKLVYVRVPAVVLHRRKRRGVHARPPLKNAHYAAHVRCLDAGLVARRCCRPWGRLSLPALEVLRLDIAPHAPSPMTPLALSRYSSLRRGHSDLTEFGAQAWGCRLPSGVRARTIVIRSLGHGLGRRIDESVVASADRIVMFLKMPASVFDMEPLPLTFAKEVPTSTPALTVVLECPRQSELAVDVLHALFQLCEVVDDPSFRLNYPRLLKVTLVVPDFVLNHASRDMAIEEIKRYRSERSRGLLVQKMHTYIGITLASEFLAQRENELVLTRREAGEYWRRSRPSTRNGHGHDSLEIRNFAHQARRLMELAGAVWNTLIDDYDVYENESEDDAMDDTYSFFGHGSAFAPSAPSRLVVC